MIRVSYRRAGDKWIGVLRDGGTVITECGHQHDNRDVTTSAGKAARVCAAEILDGARRPATADYVAERKRISWQQLNTGAGFVHPAGWMDGVKQACAESAAGYLARVDLVRAALPADEPEPVAPTEPAEAEIGDMPDWML